MVCCKGLLTWVASNMDYSRSYYQSKANIEDKLQQSKGLLLVGELFI